jgi:hypothetical protein
MKKWLFGLLSLIMIGSSIAVAMPNFSNYVCEDGNVEVSAPATQSPQDPSHDNDNLEKESDDAEDDDNQEEPSQAEEVTTYEFRTFKDYLIDYDISDQTITEDDFIGKGTKNNPYIIKSTKGFYYLKSKNSNSKYMELATDIVLNDETFDENGNPSGGDGIVYNLGVLYDWYNVFFNGNNYKISGLYIDGREKDGVYLFYSNSKILNVTFDNFYIIGNVSVGIISSCLLAENLTFRSGYIYGKQKVAPIIICSAEGKIINCNNYSTISCKTRTANDTNSHFAGIVYYMQSNALVQDCNNYGYVFGGTHCAGIASYVILDGVRIERCNNYGTIEVGVYHAAGILAYNDAHSTYIKDCNNYGALVRPSNRMCGGIVATTQKGITIESCKNFSTTSGYGYNVGEIIGYIQNRRELPSFTITIKNCKGLSGRGGFIGGIQSSTVFPKNAIVQIENSYLYNNSTVMTSNYNGLFIGNIGENISNINLEIRDTKIDYDGSWFMILGGYNNKNILNTTIENLYIKANCTRKLTMTRLTYIDHHPDWNYDIKSMIVESSYNNTPDKFYLGSDFSGFFYRNKTGEFGIRNCDASGTFNTEVTEEFLRNKSFVKEEF